MTWKFITSHSDANTGHSEGYTSSSTKWSSFSKFWMLSVNPSVSSCVHTLGSCWGVPETIYVHRRWLLLADTQSMNIHNVL